MTDRGPPVACSGALAAALLATVLASNALAGTAPRPRPRPTAPAEVQTAAGPVASVAQRRVEAGLRQRVYPARVPRARPDVETPAPVTTASLVQTEAKGRSAAAEPAEAGRPAAPLQPAPASELAGPVQPARAAIEELARLPRSRPSVPSPVLAMVEPGPEAQTGGVPPVPAGSAITLPPQPTAEDLACLSRLRDLGVEFKAVNAIDPGGSCNVDMPLEVAGVGSGVSISPKAILSCRMAEGLALWLRDSVVPAARTEMNAVPNRIANASTYVCRNRYNSASEKISEHAHANAMDVGSISFANHSPVDIKARDEAEPEGRFEATIRKESCRYFTTSLGPGSNAAHATHFHLDEAQRHGGYRVCDLGQAPVVAAAPPLNAKRE